MDSKEMEALLNALHRVNQLRLPIIVFGAGLPKILRILGEVKSYSERLFKYITVAKLSDEDVERVIPTFETNLDVGFYRIRYDRCTKKEHDFLVAMVRCGELPCPISNVAPILGKTVNAISPTRAQLISKGMIFSTGHGEIDFTVPQFDLFLKRMNPELIIEK